MKSFVNNYASNQNSTVCKAKNFLVPLRLDTRSLSIIQLQHRSGITSLRANQVAYPHDIHVMSKNKAKHAPRPCLRRLVNTRINAALVVWG